MVVQNTMTSNTSFNNNIIKDLIINNYLNLNPDEGSWDINRSDFISKVDMIVEWKLEFTFMDLNKKESLTHTTVWYKDENYEQADNRCSIETSDIQNRIKKINGEINVVFLNVKRIG